MEEQETQQETKNNKVNPLPIIGVLLIIGVVGWLVWSGSNKTASQTPTTQDTAKVQGTETTKTPSVTSGSQDKATAQAFTVNGGNFYFKPNEIHVKKGDKVTITFKNDEGFHDFVLDEFNVKTNTIPGGQETTATFTADKAGTFEYYCSVGNHRQMGMKGTLIVE